MPCVCFLHQLPEAALPSCPQGVAPLPTSSGLLLLWKNTKFTGSCLAATASLSWPGRSLQGLAAAWLLPPPLTLAGVSPSYFSYQFYLFNVHETCVLKQALIWDFLFCLPPHLLHCGTWKLLFQIVRCTTNSTQVFITLSSLKASPVDSPSGLRSLFPSGIRG